MYGFIDLRGYLAKIRPLLATAALAGLLFGLTDVRTDAQEKTPSKEELVVEDVDLETSDGVQLAVTFFHGTNGKDSVPVVILPSWRGERSEYKDLAGYLQKTNGHAVVVVDLRGHGGSDTQVVDDSVTVIDIKKFKGPELLDMYRVDLDRVKEFLLEKHIAEALDLNKLFIVGVKESCLLAQYWAAREWERKPKWRSPRWNSETVKGLVLISPLTHFKIKRTELQYLVPLRTKAVSKILSIMIIVGGEEKRSLAFARQYQAKFKPYRPPPPKDKKEELQTFFFMEKDTLLQGEKLINQTSLKVHALINGFVTHRASKTKAPWKKWVPPVGDP